MENNEVAQKILETLDKVIEEGQWGEGIFSKNILKRLQSLRQRVIDTLGDEANQTSIKESEKPPEHREGYRRVYIALYQAQGDRLDRWEHLVKNLSDFSVSRPVYSSEEHAQELMRAKRGRNDAYVVLWVKESDILPPIGGELPFDRFGHELYMIKPTGVKRENVIFFIHDGKKYVLNEGRLLLQSE